MTAAASELWIQDSLARLEALEQEREQLAGALGQARLQSTRDQHQRAIDDLDEEIRALYETLEGAAEQADGGAGTSVEDEVMRTSEFHRNPPVSTPALDEGEDDPFGAAVVARTPVPPPPTASFPGAPISSSDLAMDGLDGESSGGGALRWLAVAVVVLGAVGIGGFAMTRAQAEGPPAAAAAATGPAKVISAVPVAPDTQGPNAVSGVAADRTPATDLTPDRRGSSSRRSTGHAQRSAPEPEETGRKIKITKTSDPLAGAR